MTRLLIVDDEPDIRELIRRYAELEGYEITEAADGMEALNLCRERDFDAAVMDIMMPVMDGFTACVLVNKNWTIDIVKFWTQKEAKLI